MGRRRKTSKRFKERDLQKKLLCAAAMILLAFYVGGFLSALFLQSEVQLNPLQCIRSGLTTGAGRKWSIASSALFIVLGALIALQGKGNGEMDERNFAISPEGTYGTAGFMKKQEQEQILKTDKDTETVKGIIFGKELDTGNIISLPVDSRLNRNIAVCGSQGSMKSRAFARVMALQCVRRGESMYITDPKSELYEDLCAYLKSEGYTVKQLNLIQLTHSDAWNCLAEINGGELIDVFCDVVIRNTTDKFDHFYDNVEMDLLKALCLYVYEEYPAQQKTFPEAYKLLLNKSVEALDSVFERLPGNHPAKGPYQLFSKAEKVKGNAVLGLGTRLQILQNKLVQQITSHTDIDLTLPGREKCAYFCITSDQDSTYDMLATLFTSFLSIKLVRFADKTEERKLPIPMNFILDEFPNIGVVPDFKKKLATARSRAIGMSILYQNIPQLQNRYPDNQWEEILGGCDFSIFLGCNDMTTASYFSDRTGEITVAVSSIRKNYHTIRATDYVPEYTESSSVGKRQLLLPDEVLRYPLDQGLLIIRGQKVLRFRKMDYTEHMDAAKLRMEKVEAHIPDWYPKWEQEKAQFCMRWERGAETPEDERFHREIKKGDPEDILPLDAPVPKKEKKGGKKSGRIVMKVEDLFLPKEGRE